jgi:hypothetical protein
MTEAEIKSQPEWARQLEEDIGAVVGLVIISAVTFGIADYALAGAAVAEEVGAEAAAEATAEVTAEAAAGEAAIVDGGGEAVTEDILTDSFVNEVNGAGEGAVMFGDDFSAIAEVELDGSQVELDGSLVSLDGLGADAIQDQLLVWGDSEYTSLEAMDAAFESQVAIDVDAAEGPLIFDDYFAADAAGAVETDVEADAEEMAKRQAERAVAQAFAGFGFF